MNLRATFIGAAIAVAVLCAAGPANAIEIDPTFGASGQQQLRLPDSSRWAYVDSEVGKDGAYHVLLRATNYKQLAIASVKATGALNRSFGSIGVRVTKLPKGHRWTATGIAALKDGGLAVSLNRARRDRQTAMVALFDSSGRQVTGFPRSVSGSTKFADSGGIAVDDRGRINTFFAANNKSLVAMRLDESGRIERSYGGDRQLNRTALKYEGIDPLSIVDLADGSVAISAQVTLTSCDCAAGPSSDDRPVIGRFDPSGRLVKSFTGSSKKDGHRWLNSIYGSRGASLFRGAGGGVIALMDITYEEPIPQPVPGGNKIEQITGGEFRFLTAEGKPDKSVLPTGLLHDPLFPFSPNVDRDDLFAVGGAVSPAGRIAMCGNEIVSRRTPTDPYKQTSNGYVQFPDPGTGSDVTRPATQVWRSTSRDAVDGCDWQSETRLLTADLSGSLGPLAVTALR